MGRRKTVLLSRKETALILGVEPDAVTDLLMASKIKGGFKRSKGLSSEWFIPSSEVEIFLKKEVIKLEKKIAKNRKKKLLKAGQIVDKFI